MFASRNTPSLSLWQAHTRIRTNFECVRAKCQGSRFRHVEPTIARSTTALVYPVPMCICIHIYYLFCAFCELVHRRTKRFVWLSVPKHCRQAVCACGIVQLASLYHVWIGECASDAMAISLGMCVCMLTIAKIAKEHLNTHHAQETCVPSWRRFQEHLAVHSTLTANNRASTRLMTSAHTHLWTQITSRWNNYNKSAAAFVTARYTRMHNIPCRAGGLICGTQLMSV